MPYCTLDDITAHIPDKNIMQLTDDEGLGQTDTERVDEAIAYADAFIDGYLRGRHVLPLNPVPMLINKLSVDLAIFHLYSRRLEYEMGDAMLLRYKNAVKLLEQIQKGLIKLGIESAETGPGQGHYKTNKTANNKTFSKDVLEKF